MKIIAVNAGSSSLKFQLLDMPSETEIVSGIVERIGIKNSVIKIKLNGEKIVEELDIPDHGIAVELILSKLVDLNIVKDINEIDGVGHRVVHGGEKFSDSVVIDDEVIKAIEVVSDLAPLHNPANLTGIRAFKKALPHINGVAVFDTAFHHSIPEAAYMYALPYEYYKKYGIRKYGFHGSSHEFISLAAKKILWKSLNQSTISNFKDKQNIIMGYRLGQKLNLKVGDYISLISPNGMETALGVLPVNQNFKIGGFFDMGMYEYDNNFIFIPWKKAELFLSTNNIAHGIEVFLKDQKLTSTVNLQLQSKLNKNLIVIDWKKRNSSFMNALAVEKNVMFVILTLIILVAAFNIISSMIMLVQTKKADIALMRTMGASQYLIIKVFILNVKELKNTQEIFKE